jgi:2Fe-2S ferredoxin
MITVNFMRGQEVIPVKVNIGMTIMEAARDFSDVAIDEIPADCGGCCACATCHVRIDQKWTSIIGEPNKGSIEIDLLEYSAGYDRMESRLGCQVSLEKKHDGLVVHLLDNHKL